MKSIEIKNGDKVIYKNEIVTVWQICLNKVIIELPCGSKEMVSYSQINKINDKSFKA